MNLDSSMQLSGKGCTVTTEWQDDNILLRFDKVRFYQVNVDEKIVGWLAIDPFVLLADLITHTSKGAMGRSVEEEVQGALLLDPSNRLASIMPDDLESVITDEATEKLNEILGRNWTSKMHFNFDHDDKDALILFSHQSELVFIQTNESSVRIGHGGVLVYDRKKEKIVDIGESGVHVAGKDGESVRIEEDSIKFGNWEFDPETIAENIERTVESALKSLKFKF